MPLGNINRAAQRAHQESTHHFKILNPLAQPDASATVVAGVLQEIDNLTSAAIATSDPKALSLHLWETWWALLEIVARTPPAQQSKLIDFIAHLQKKP
jgi:type III secretory pathway component EscT